MGKRGGRTTTKQQAENINAVTMETEDPPTETYTNVMTTYLWHGIKAFQRAPQYHAPGLTFPQFLLTMHCLAWISQYSMSVLVFKCLIHPFGHMMASEYISEWLIHWAQRHESRNGSMSKPTKKDIPREQKAGFEI
jgi:hypothetical protein